MEEKIKEIKEKILNKIYKAIVEDDAIKSPENIMFIAKTIYFIERDVKDNKEDNIIKEEV